jgi:molybdenum cofactor cytidylyltransferase
MTTEPVLVGGVAAVVLAAGLSTRMGRPKMTLRWGEGTVIGQVTGVLLEAGAAPVVAVTGGAQQAVEAALARLPVQKVFNPRFAEDSMALSLQIGLRALPETVCACLVALGDQPQLQIDCVRAILEAFRRSQAELVVPAWQGRRGHPWLVARPLWDGLLALQPPLTLRDWMRAQAAHTLVVDVSSDSILRDLDTPQDYSRERP